MHNCKEVSSYTFDKFDFSFDGSKESFSLICKLEFMAQNPCDSNRLSRAILIKFSAKGKDTPFRVLVEFRAVFDFETQEEMVSGEDLIAQYKDISYFKMKQCVNRILKTMQQNPIPFPDLDD